MVRTDARSHLVDLFVLKQKGTRLTFPLEDKPGALFGVLKVLKDHKVNVISAVSPSFFVEGKRVQLSGLKRKSMRLLLKIWEKPVIRYYPLANGHPYKNHQMINFNQKGEVRSRMVPL